MLAVYCNINPIWQIGHKKELLHYKHIGQVEASQFSCYVDNASLEFARIFPSAEIAGVHLRSGLLLNHGYFLCITVCGAPF